MIGTWQWQDVGKDIVFLLAENCTTHKYLPQGFVAELIRILLLIRKVSDINHDLVHKCYHQRRYSHFSILISRLQILYAARLKARRVRYLIISYLRFGVSIIL